MSTAAPVVVAISGSPDFADALPPGMAPEAWLPVATYAFRGKDAVASYLAQHPDFVLLLPRLMEAAQALSAGAAAFLARWPNVATNFAGRDLCRLVLCQVDPGNEESLYGSVPIVVGPDRKVAFGDPWFLRYRATDDKDLQLIGDGDYVTEHILRDDAAGRQFLPDQAIETWRSASKIEDLPSITADEVAVAIIRAAEPQAR